MRSTRLLSLIGLLLFVPAVASAQEKNPFTDSWFWGAKGGLIDLHTTDARTQAPVIGADWLITRTWYALYVGLDQAYFDAVSTVDNAPTNGTVRKVDIRDMRRFTVAPLMFPRVWFNSLRPYVGLGYSFNFVVRASSQGENYATPQARDTVLARIQSAKTRNSLILMSGLQFDWKRVAPFVQATVMPTRGAGEFLINGNGFTYYIEGGLRYNFGSSIEKLK